jgi:chromosome segregation ATPase
LQSVEREKEMQDRLNAVLMDLDQAKKECSTLEEEKQNLEYRNICLFKDNVSLETQGVEDRKEMQNRLNAVLMNLDQVKKERDTLGGEKQDLENLNGDLSQKIIVLELQSVEREKEMQDRLNAVLMDLDQAKKECSTLEEEKQNLEYRNICLFKDNVSLNTQLIESEKETDILDEEVEQLDRTLKTFQRKSRRNLCCLALTSIPTVMFCLRWGILEFLRAQKYYSI